MILYTLKSIGLMLSSIALFLFFSLIAIYPFKQRKIDQSIIYKTLKPAYCLDVFYYKTTSQRGYDKIIKRK